MVFYHLSMKESVTIFLIFHLPLLSWQLHKVAKNNNGELVSSSRQFCTWHIFSQKWKKKHPVKYDDAIYLIPIRLLLEKWNVFLPYKKRILICKIDLFTRSWVPKKIKGHPSSWFIHWVPLTCMKREFCVTLRFFPLWDKFSCSERLNFGFVENCIEIYFMRTSGISLFITGVRYKFKEVPLIIQ